MFVSNYYQSDLYKPEIRKGLLIQLKLCLRAWVSMKRAFERKLNASCLIVQTTYLPPIDQNEYLLLKTEYERRNEIKNH